MGLHPQNAKKMIKKAYLRIGVLYVLLGSICYFGWGDEIEHRKPLEKLYILSYQHKGYAYLANIITVLFTLKTILIYPIMFLPLCRELESLLELDVTVAVELRLPWAQRQQLCNRRMVRIILVILSVCP